ncbi:MAG: polyprenyl diphosphate synthase [Candidatus Methanomethylophilaceae archaeon]|jgi:tritrans,polycis-undecaprenyl-diphosphate synthase [geranylgeranyl-diphosphate specific]|nr:polyprenyl diphosphate synthase [Candidatus Methanomethylophilaceae archaeon]NLF33601.1 di-trans,poly-cis-decaprenylcistransferase [Thermoplasmatales archaeon]
MALPKIISNAAYSTYESQLEKEVLAGPVPGHLAIIMDGNRRYAKEVLQAEPREGHIMGRAKLEEVLGWCMDTGIKVLTVYAFSTENFNRDQEEVSFLMDLISQALRDFADDPRVHENRVRVGVLGDPSMLPESMLEAISYADERTSGYSDHHLNMAVAYGGRQEIVTAVKEIARKVKEGAMDVEDITEGTLSGHMYMSSMPDPDLVLRTSGEVRISNFLLWQMAYSELYFTDVYWPGFRYIDFLRSIRAYQQRSRRYGT